MNGGGQGSEEGAVNGKGVLRLRQRWAWGRPSGRAALWRNRHEGVAVGDNATGEAVTR